MTQLSSNFNRRIMAIASAMPELVLQSAYALPNSNTAFRINVTHSNAGVDYTESDYAEMVSAMTANKFALVANTMAWLNDIPGNGARLLSGIIEANLAVKEFNDEEIKAKYRTLAANVFIDDEDSIWRVVENNGVKQLVQSVNEDFKQLIASRIARKSSQVIAANFGGLVPASGDYVQYYDAANRAVSFGFALMSSDKGLIVVDRMSKQEVPISAANVLNRVEGDSIDTSHSIAVKLRKDNVVTADDLTRNQIFKDYVAKIKELYAGTDFFNKLEVMVAKYSKLKGIPTDVQVALMMRRKPGGF